MLLPILPAAIQKIPIRISLIACPMLLCHFPAACEHISIGKKVRTLSFTLIWLELSYVLVASIGSFSPPELTKTLLNNRIIGISQAISILSNLFAHNILSLVPVPANIQIESMTIPAVIFPISDIFVTTGPGHFSWSKSLDYNFRKTVFSKTHLFPAFSP